ncbi:uncharacterized protein M421DRAFT_310762 [Didymella exigua CBS 183.55]|uniref:Uncharacterized protein n=1 Tax=Didymella exigua CBS 183.55 TaxID=1150837 RepID=A0A6A5R8X0_9PLEO|nr:uncharacterized protein M421DRAFT_310762 [Didymella exigua CBS 183.55]KAF1923628.1 hypothetical protein M421DRAFT_310762 [Didymella exigua CBS 183.55]
MTKGRLCPNIAPIRQGVATLSDTQAAGSQRHLEIISRTMRGRTIIACRSCLCCGHRSSVKTRYSLLARITWSLILCSAWPGPNCGFILGARPTPQIPHIVLVLNSEPVRSCLVCSDIGRYTRDEASSDSAIGCRTIAAARLVYCSWSPELGPTENVASRNAGRRAIDAWLICRVRSSC